MANNLRTVKELHGRLNLLKSPLKGSKYEVFPMLNNGETFYD